MIEYRTNRFLVGDSLKNIKGYVFVALSAVIFGCMPLMTVNIYDEGVNTLSLLALRSLLALPFVAAIMKVRKISFKITLREFFQIGLVCALGSAITPAMLFYSYKFISTGMATTLHFIYPALVTAGCSIIFRRPTKLCQWLCALLCCGGAMLFCSFDGSVDLFGIMLAAGSGAVYAAYIIGLEKSGVEHIDPFKYCFYGLIFCAAIMLSATLFTNSLTIPNTVKGWALCFVFAVVVMVLAIILFQTGVGIIGPQKASILSTFEPITGTVIGAIIFGEPFGVKSFIGTVMIISAVILLSLLENSENEQNV